MNGFDQLQSVAVALAAVLACVYGLSLLAKRMRRQIGSNRTDCEIISSTFVGPKERVLLLRVRNRELLIGVGQNHMCRLGEFAVADEPVPAASTTSVPKFAETADSSGMARVVDHG